MANNVRRKRYTVYDAMEANGYFDSNPANIYAVAADTGESIYELAKYPMMLYHPEGKTKVVKPEEREMTSFGPHITPARSEMIYKIVNSKQEMQNLLDEGWHKHPVHAMIARGDTDIPPISAAERIQELEEAFAELAEKKKELKELEEEVTRLRAANRAKFKTSEAQA